MPSDRYLATNTWSSIYASITNIDMYDGTLLHEHFMPASLMSCDCENN